MKVIIIGAGKVGSQLVETLLNDKHDVTVIDISQEIIDNFTDNFDVLAIKATGFPAACCGKLTAAKPTC